uniref:Uncharacterized protein n=1 Tax=Rhizophora mucronata TaxID=61149 RepID=A0A2P2QY88_RHIMU
MYRRGCSKLLLHFGCGGSAFHASSL